MPLSQNTCDPEPCFSASHDLMSDINFSLVPAKQRTVALTE